MIFGSTVTNDREYQEWVETNYFVAVNRRNIPTFSNENGNSIIDTTVATIGVIGRFDN